MNSGIQPHLLTTIRYVRSDTTTTKTIMSNTDGLALKLVFAPIFLLIIVGGVLGNIFVASVIITDRKVFTGTINLLLFNLAIADLGNLLACCPDIVQFLIGLGWLLPDVLCPLVRFLEEYFLYASVLMQMSIGIERFMAICRPFHMQRISVRSTIFVILSIWMVAALFALPYLIFQRIYEHSSIRFCVWSRQLTAKYKLVFKMSEFLVLYVVPLVLLTIIYSLMGYVLWGHQESIHATQKQKAAILRLRRSVVKMLIVSILLYFICYSPIQGFFTIRLILQRDIRIGPAVRLTLNALSVFSSSANPVVYIVCCRHFRVRFLAILHILSPKCFPAAVYGIEDGTSALPNRTMQGPMIRKQLLNSSTMQTYSIASSKKRSFDGSFLSCNSDRAEFLSQPESLSGHQDQLLLQETCVPDDDSGKHYPGFSHSLL